MFGKNSFATLAEKKLANQIDDDQFAKESKKIGVGPILSFYKSLAIQPTIKETATNKYGEASMEDPDWPKRELAIQVLGEKLQELKNGTRKKILEELRDRLDINKEFTRRLSRGKAFPHEINRHIRQAILEALEQFPGKTSIEGFLTTLRLDPSTALKMLAYENLISNPTPETIADILLLRDSLTPKLRNHLARLQQRLPEDELEIIIDIASKKATDDDHWKIIFTSVVYRRLHMTARESLYDSIRTIIATMRYCGWGVGEDIVKEQLNKLERGHLRLVLEEAKKEEMDQRFLKMIEQKIKQVGA